MTTYTYGCSGQRYRQVAIMHRKGRFAAVVKGEVPPRRHGDGQQREGSITKSKFRMAGGGDADNGRYTVLMDAVIQYSHTPSSRQCAMQTYQLLTPFNKKKIYK